METAVPREHLINARRSFGNFNKATEENHEFLQRQLGAQTREDEAEKDAVGDEEMAAFCPIIWKEENASSRHASTGILGKRGQQHQRRREKGRRFQMKGSGKGGNKRARKR